jgi:hypothetical protein
MDYYNYRKEGEFYYCDLLGINNEDYCKIDKDVHDNYQKLHELMIKYCVDNYNENNLHYYNLGKFVVGIGMSECFIGSNGVIVPEMFEFINKYNLIYEIAKEYKKRLPKYSFYVNINLDIKVCDEFFECQDVHKISIDVYENRDYVLEFLKLNTTSYNNNNYYFGDDLCIQIKIDCFIINGQQCRSYEIINIIKSRYPNLFEQKLVQKINL